MNDWKLKFAIVYNCITHVCSKHFSGKHFIKCIQDKQYGIIPRAFSSFTHAQKLAHTHIHQSQQFLLSDHMPLSHQSTITPLSSVELLNKAVHLRNKIKKDTELLRINFVCIPFKPMIFSINCDRCFFLPFLIVSHYFTETIEFLVFNAVVVRLVIEEQILFSSAFEWKREKCCITVKLRYGNNTDTFRLTIHRSKHKICVEKNRQRIVCNAKPH